MSTTTETIPIRSAHNEPESQHREPLKLSGVLDQYESFDVTPAIGREFKQGNLREWLEASNSDELIRDLAITISQRGVVFFRSQNDLTNDLQKQLISRIGLLAGKPPTSGLHIHPIVNSGRRLGTYEEKDPQISVISSETNKKLFGNRWNSRKQTGKEGWHSDITFEPVPSDYALLRLTQLPSTGGDTLWASGYEVYDRLSPAYAKFLEGLTATYAQPEFNAAAARAGFELYAAERGAPENVGTDLTAIHPVIRTNPVTGWKSVFAVGQHCQRVNEVSDEESEHLLKWFVRLITENHDLQVRFKWQNENDVAIWDNRSVYHTATYDVTEKREGQRAVSLGERPYFDEGSRSRKEALFGQQENVSYKGGSR